MGLTVSEVAQVAGFSRPAATRLLESLMTDSIIVRDPQSKRYRLGLRLYEWSNLAVQASTPVNIARREFIKLATEIRRECNLLVLEDLDAVLVERAEDVDGIPVNRPVPGRRRWFLTATGKVMVACLPEGTAATIIERTRQLPDAPSDIEALVAELPVIREQGYAVNVGIRPEGMLSLGVSITGQSGIPVASVGTFMPVSDYESEEGANALVHMKATASRISHYLGYGVETASAIS
jgi:IclR family KDG regulon transcriptional repressor